MYSWKGWGYSGLQVVRRIEGSSLGFNLFFCDFLGSIILGSNIACSVSISWMHSSADQTCLGVFLIITWNTLSCIDPVLPVMVYSEYTQLDEFSSIMFMFIHYLTSSVRALFRIRPATPGHLGWGLGNGLCPISVKKNPHYWNKTHIQSYVYFSRPCLLSHIQSWNYQKICVGVFWGQYIFDAGILFWKAPWGLRPCHFKSGVLFLGCVYFCFIKKLYKY